MMCFDRNSKMDDMRQSEKWWTHKGGGLLIGVTAVVAPMLHLLSDVLEWHSGGFSQTQLVINLFGFLPMPFLIIGLNQIQRQRAGWPAAVGAILYAWAFVYFTYTTIYSLAYSVPTYQALWNQLGWIYTFHGGLMIVGGLMFGVSALKAKVLSRIALALFVIGLMLNLIVSLLPVPEVVQILGSTIRNLGLIGIGVHLLLRPTLDSTHED